MYKVKYQMVSAILWTLTFKKNYHLRPLSYNEIQTMTSRNTEYSEISSQNSNGYMSSLLLWLELTSDESNVASFKKFQKNDQLQEHLMMTEWQYISMWPLLSTSCNTCCEMTLSFLFILFYFISMDLENILKALSRKYL